MAVRWSALSVVAGGALLACTTVAGCGSGDSSGSGGTSGAAGSDGGGAAGMAGSSGKSCNNNGTVEPGEDCDDGNLTPKDGCENDCTFTCTKGTVNGDAKCDDKDPCNGVETCADDHTCTAGAPAADNTDCGNGKVCKGGVCGDSTCGDAVVTGTEECDDGNTANGDGCDSCKFSCLSTDATRDCTPTDPCNGTITCNDATHTCNAPTSVPADGTSCGSNNAYCSGGVCTTPVCGNGKLEPGETCDDNNVTPGDGCEANCTYTCGDPTTDCTAAPVCQKNQCNASHVCEAVADTTQDNNNCGGTSTCQNGVCQAPGTQCGNGVKEAGEDCDFGTASNGPGTGCETNCKFSCTKNPNSCLDQNSCNGAESCVNVTVGGKAGQKCQAGTPPAACSTCTGGICVNSNCAAPTCGDGCVTSGETCEPPNTSTCDAACHTVVVAQCGNGVRESGEQCDDSNTLNLDGCDSTCKFEQNQRVDWLQMQFATDTFCTANQLGAAIPSTTAQNLVNDGGGGTTRYISGVGDGSINVMFALLAVTDLSGTNGTTTLGPMTGTLANPYTGAFTGLSDLDWWYHPEPTAIDANRVPTASIAGTFATKVLTAGPGRVTVTIVIAGAPGTFTLSAAKITASVGGTSAPTASSGSPPGHLAAEHLDPALTSFASLGAPNQNGAAKLCGNVPSAALAAVAVPASLTSGLTKCNQNYTAANSLLDVIITGCNVIIVGQAIKPTQPDTVDPNAPAAGAGPAYTLSASGSNHVVDTCKDKNGATVNLATCMNHAAYSAFFKFATDRVVIK